MTKSPLANRIAKLAAAPLLLAALGACASSFNADVSRFQTQLPAPQGQSFAVVADDPRLAGGLEFALYADFIEAEMAQLGYSQAATPEDATLLVRFDYGVDEGRERIRSSGFARDPYFSRFRSYRPFHFRDRFGRVGLSRFGSRSFAFGFHDPFFGGNNISSVTIFTSGIDIKIDEAASGERLFEGKAEAVSTSNRLQYLVPNLVEAMFTDFPGGNGETVRISIKPEDQPVRRNDRS